MKNKKETYEINKRQIEILKKYYEVDEENKIVSVKFNLSSDKEMLETSIGNDNSSMFNGELLEKINSIFDTIPFIYKIDIEFDIDGELTQSPDKTLEAFNDTLEIGQISSRKEIRKKWFIATLLILSGIILLIFMILSSHYEWFGSSLNSEIINEILDISAWVFIWEAVTLLFLEPSKTKLFNIKIKNRVNSIAIYKKGENTPLVKENSNDIFGDWKDESKLKIAGKASLLVSSGAFIVMAFYSCYQLIKILSSLENIEIGIIIGSSMIAFITFLLYFISGIGGFYRYSNRKNILSRFVGPFALFLFVQLVFVTTISAIASDWSAITGSIYGLILSLMYIFGYLVDKKFEN